jgi:hypothetical protein
MIYTSGIYSDTADDQSDIPYGVFLLTQSSTTIKTITSQSNQGTVVSAILNKDYTYTVYINIPEAAGITVGYNIVPFVTGVTGVTTS